MHAVAHDWIVTQREREFEQSAADELPTLVLADDVSQLLVHVIEQVRIDPNERDRLAEEPRRNALWFMAIVTVRAMRSAMQVLATGYEEQSVGFQKLIDELHERAQQIRADESGEAARRWLSGKAIDRASRLPGQALWESLTRPVQSDTTAVLDWLAISKGGTETRVVIGPERRPEVANAAITHMASEGRDIATLLSLEVGLELPDLGDLDARIHDAYDTYIPDATRAGDEV